MNSRQRRGVIILLLSVLCAVGAFVGVLSVISDVNSKVGPEVAAYELKADVAPYTPLRADQFRKTEMPKRWLSPNAVTDLSALNGKVAVTRLEKGSLLQDDMIVKRPELAPDEQEIAIMIDAATGVAGKITPGSLVNIFATFAAEGQNGKAQSRIIVPNAKVIDVGKLTALQPGNDNRTANAMQEAVPITFALKTKDAQRVAYAESFAEHVRLALLADGSTTTLRPGESTYTLEGDK
ncbi:pilus assembly protein CpaB [Streptomyces sp. 150FB]|jgi:pilus assembly protein CpaB|uniref:Flp pilus assembly protein CpaB n=1 Tax=Streptomyces sp. 150FB TaxID=1576605 RepID=UPI000588F2AB|nr:Flp pilus assembly protein CpaB [Streptomyces sp. 150FB]KIF76455.1 pilus assembly protein CpaB [Streptomyces sp. 150FB]